MFVKSTMIPKARTIHASAEDSLLTVLEKLEKHKIDGIPVLKGTAYIGMITRYNLYEHFFQSNADKEEFLKIRKAEEIAVNRDVFLEGDEIFEKTLLRLKDFPLIAVVGEDKEYLGIVTRYDVLEQFQSAFGMNKKGVRIAFTSVETEGRIARLTELAKQFHEDIISLVTFDETESMVRRIVMKIEKKDNIKRFIERIEKSGFRVLDIHEDE
ncbi:MULTISPECIES: CBS domain-containing protein [Metabacillus]|uniref:CBS domain-containing protein n=1 Tax=Metabacillus hrfriensis TaxID=3048891 RepID=A0ACD4R794_9BACI|nr:MULTISPECIES: CBS domain-containing protein [Metabacillus]UAL50847.1 CBS domain-containing protein [Metabacillus dongyingensis]USK27123.1 CBS domain-containing protein [Bacillus sp. CMF21]WHZ56345.1 CBS domain-containing protein [Metabacillus sp. CT-WN-B3]